MVPATRLRPSGHGRAAAPDHATASDEPAEHQQRWRSDLGAAWHRLTGLVAQPNPPTPATYTRRSTH
jgi:hypothetical protein